MKKSLLLVCLCHWAFWGLHAQLGFTIAPTQALAPQWQILVENYITHQQADFLKHGVTATFDHTFPLKYADWEIGPALHLSQLQFDYWEHEFRAFSAGLQGNINFTPFREMQQKGGSASRLFFQLSPGLDYVRMRYFRLNPEGGGQQLVEILSDGKFSPHIGLNLLLEFRLTDLLTVTPMGGVRYFPGLEWEGFSQTISEGNFHREYDRVNWRHLCFGFRIGLDLGAGK